VDEADVIAEFDEANNTRAARVAVKRFDAQPSNGLLSPAEAQPIPP
jgi:hypothetical protein